jgi:hypothetical protein
MNHNIITSTLVPESQRAEHAGKNFGVRFLWIESFVFDTAGSLSREYDGGLWDIYALSNAGFYMAPRNRRTCRVECANGFNGELSSDAFGVTCCLYAYSLLSFSSDDGFAEVCAENFHRLREFALQHGECHAILRATD